MIIGEGMVGVRILDGHGNPAGWIIVDDFEHRISLDIKLEWTRRIWHTTNTFTDRAESLTLSVFDTGLGYVAKTTAKERQKLKKAHLLIT